MLLRPRIEIGRLEERTAADPDDRKRRTHALEERGSADAQIRRRFSGAQLRGHAQSKSRSGAHVSSPKGHNFRPLESSSSCREPSRAEQDRQAQPQTGAACIWLRFRFFFEEMIEPILTQSVRKTAKTRLNPAWKLFRPRRVFHCMTKSIAASVLVCLGLLACGGVADSAPEPEPVCYVGEAQGKIVDSIDEPGRLFCCTIICFDFPGAAGDHG